MDVKTVCLGALTMGDATGYEIRKMFEEGPFAHFYDASYGSIYPALNALLADDLVSVTQMAQDKRPDKKVYRLMPAGLARFKAALAESPSRDKIRSEHLVRLFFAHHMGTEGVEQVFDSYLAHFDDAVRLIESLQPDDVAGGRKFVRSFGQTLYATMAAFMREHRAALLQTHADEAGAKDAPPVRADGADR